MDKKNIVNSVLLGTLVMLLLGIVYSYSIFRVEIESQFNVSSVESGLPYMFVLFFYSLFMFIGGLMYSRYSTKKISLLGIALIVTGFILSSLTTSIFFITLSYGVLIGTGIGLLYHLPLRVVAHLDHPRIGFLTGITILGFGMSSLIFAPVINGLINLVGLKSTFLVLGIIYFIVLTPLVLKLQTKDTTIKVKEKISYPMVKDKRFYTIYLLFFISTFIGLTFIGFIGNIGIELIGLSVLEVSIFIAAFSIFNGIGRPLWGYINDKIGFTRSAVISYASIIIATLLHYYIPNSLLIFIIAFMVFYINFGGWLSLAPAATIKTFGKEDYSKNYGLVFTAYGLGAIIGNFSGSIISDTFELRTVFLLMCILAVIGLMIVTISKDIKKQGN